METRPADEPIVVPAGLFRCGVGLYLAPRYRHQTGWRYDWYWSLRCLGVNF